MPFLIHNYHVSRSMRGLLTYERRPAADRRGASFCFSPSNPGRRAPAGAACGKFPVPPSNILHDP